VITITNHSCSGSCSNQN